ncbi:hypothetical protein B5D82_12350 [Cognaticolwellia beringensis]|uniref:Uncharacterized protein n=1 Tax=Cognaticolwellia beringensis TaxID=1967665 RepID=A0A222G9E7_9GAMM|nr:hypothetical protein B5D82_12350 [Cognaticolwellia beringensis]
MPIVEPNINLKMFILSLPAKVLAMVEGKVAVRRYARIAQAPLLSFFFYCVSMLIYPPPKRVGPITATIVYSLRLALR